MIRNSKVISYLIILFFFQFCFSQKAITIDESIQLMQLNSVEFKAIERSSEIEKLGYSIYRNSFLPRVDVQATLPTYFKSINSITQPDGSNFFLEQEQANSQLNLNVYQKIPFTGGELIINSSLERLDLISNKTTSYTSNWFNILLTQPLNGYNSFKWGKKINKIKFNSNFIEIYKRVENLNKDVVDFYFETFMGQCRIELTKKNITLTEQYLKNTELLIEHGRKLEPEKLKVKLSLSQLKIKLESNKINHLNNIIKLKQLLGYDKSDSLVLIEPKIFNKPEIDSIYLKERLLKFSVNYGFELDLIESERDLARAKSEKGLQLDLQIGYGFNSNSQEVSGLYKVPSKREYLNLGLNIPLVAWNEKGKRYEIQKLIHENLKDRFEKQKNKLYLSVKNLVFRVESLYNTIEYNKEYNEINKQYLDISNEMYNHDRLTLNEFKRELFEEEKRIIDYLYSIKSLWLMRYNLRESTLYDFFTKETLYTE